MMFSDQSSMQLAANRNRVCAAVDPPELQGLSLRLNHDKASALLVSVQLDLVQAAAQ